MEGSRIIESEFILFFLDEFWRFSQIRFFSFGLDFILENTSWLNASNELMNTCKVAPNPSFVDFPFCGIPQGHGVRIGQMWQTVNCDVSCCHPPSHPLEFLCVAGRWGFQKLPATTSDSHLKIHEYCFNCQLTVRSWLDYILLDTSNYQVN